LLCSRVFKQISKLLGELLIEASEEMFNRLLTEQSLENIIHFHEPFGLSRECEVYMDRIPWVLAGIVELFSEVTRSRLRECIDLIVADENARRSVRYVMPARISLLLSKIRRRLNASDMTSC